jgi:hypothetical protein
MPESKTAAHQALQFDRSANPGRLFCQVAVPGQPGLLERGEGLEVALASSGAAGLQHGGFEVIEAEGVTGSGCGALSQDEAQPYDAVWWSLNLFHPSRPTTNTGGRPTPLLQSPPCRPDNLLHRPFVARSRGRPRRPGRNRTDERILHRTGRDSFGANHIEPTVTDQLQTAIA